MKAAELKKLITTRPDCTSDQYVCQQVCGEYKRLPFKGRTVFDLGANIGAFAVYAMEMGAEKVISYEPHPENFALLKENTLKYGDRVECYEGAVSCYLQAELPLFVGNGSAMDGHTLRTVRGRSGVMVRNYNLTDELKLHNPDTVKMDVEGAEFQLLDIVAAYPTVKDVVAEIHFSTKRMRADFEDLVAEFDDWDTVIQPKETGSNFHTLGQWSRK